MLPRQYKVHPSQLQVIRPRQLMVTTQQVQRTDLNFKILDLFLFLTRYYIINSLIYVYLYT